MTDNVGSVECGTPPGTVPGTPGLGDNPVNHVLHLVGQSSSQIEYNKGPGPRTLQSAPEPVAKPYPHTTYNM